MMFFPKPFDILSEGSSSSAAVVVVVGSTFNRLVVRWTIIITILFEFTNCRSNSSYYSLWEDLYFGCGRTVSFSCVQNKLTDYVNDTLNSDIRVTDGIYFVRNGRSVSNSFALPSDGKLFYHLVDGGTSSNSDDEKTDHNATSFAGLSSRNGRFLCNDKPEITVNNNNNSDNTSGSGNRVKMKWSDHSAKDDKLEINNDDDDDDNKEEEHFRSFVSTLEVVERNLDEQNEIKSKEGSSSSSNSSTVKREATSRKLTDNNSNPANEEVNGATAEPEDNKADDGRNLATIWSLYRVTDVLYDKASRYFTTHDLHLHLPVTLFGGGQLKISPKGYDSDDGGVLVKFNVLPPSSMNLPRAGGTAAGGHNNNGFVSKYFHKVFKKKLLTSFLALLLIIKLIKIKLMYVLPFLIGVNHAKKLLLKTLLFLFPPLVHLFKLCTFYHAHASKLHFHHHKVKHHHHHIKVPVPVPIPVPVHKPHYGTHEEEYPPGASLSPSDYPSVEPYGHPTIDHPTQEVYPSPNYNGYETPAGGPTDDYYNKNDVSSLQKHSDEFASWGLKDFYASTESPGVLSAQAQAFSPYAEQNYNHNNNKYPVAASGAIGGYNNGGHSSLYNSRISNYPTASGISYKDPYNVNVKKTKNTNSWKSKPSVATGFSSQAGAAAIGSTGGGGFKNGPTVLVTYDPFYSPILQKIDALFTQLGFNDEGCRERLICSMYKNPVRFSPHSNLLSTELSRDPDELEKPIHHNVAVIRFYRYVDAARNGQAQKDCLKFYTSCSVKTE